MEEDPALTGQLALETGGNLATIATNTTGVATAANQATQITSLGVINSNTAPLVVSSAGGYIRQDSTGTIAKESGGNLAILAGAVTSAVLQDNVKQVGGNGVVTAGINGLLAVGGNVASGASDSGYPLKIGGVYNSSPITLTNGQRGDLQMTANGSGQFNLNTLIAGEDLTNNVLRTEQHGTYANITTATTTTVKSGAGFLYRLIVNTLVASATITLYDNTAGSGTKIGTITLPSTITGDQPFALPYDIAFGTGLTIVTSGATDITVSYR